MTEVILRVSQKDFRENGIIHIVKLNNEKSFLIKESPLLKVHNYFNLLMKL